ncbi:hypothetical protein A2U01_0039448, partial [Trifolium medium]|nr:hypothetical protein [Trifolium medium]
MESSRRDDPVIGCYGRDDPVIGCYGCDDPVIGCCGRGVTSPAIGCHHGDPVIGCHSCSLEGCETSGGCRIHCIR